MVFGSGYVLPAFLRADLVVHRGWLTDGQLPDSIAVGQVTPGPVFTTATFIGYLLGGLPGAVVSWQLGRASIVDAETAVLALVALVVLLLFRVNSGWLVLPGAVAGVLIRRGH